MFLNLEGNIPWSAFNSWVAIAVEFHPVIFTLGKTCSVCIHEFSQAEQYVVQPTNQSQQGLLIGIVLIVLAVNG